MHINENAFVARKARHNGTGKVATVFHGHNTNTSDDIVWVAVEGQRTVKLTSKKSIAAVYADMDAAIASGEATDLKAVA